MWSASWYDCWRVALGVQPVLHQLLCVRVFSSTSQSLCETMRSGCCKQSIRPCWWGARLTDFCVTLAHSFTYLFRDSSWASVLSAGSREDGTQLPELLGCAGSGLMYTQNNDYLPLIEADPWVHTVRGLQNAPTLTDALKLNSPLPLKKAVNPNPVSLPAMWSVFCAHSANARTAAGRCVAVLGVIVAVKS